MFFRNGELLKENSWRRRIFVISRRALLLSLLLAGCSLSSPSQPSNTSASESFDQIQTANLFLEAVATGDEEIAVSHISADLLEQVENQCANAMLMRCFDDVGGQEWGELENIVFERGKPARGVMLFWINWQDTPDVYVAVTLVKENDVWLVNGWRGFTPDPGGLLDGTNRINAFPLND